MEAHIIETGDGRDERARGLRETGGPLAPAAAVSMTPVSWQAQERLAFPQWLEQGRRLGIMGRGAGWWIGDWLRYGSTRYRDRYARAARITGYDSQTLMNMVYVASRYEVARRRERLSWSHHAEVAPLSVEEQERWLDRCAAGRLSIRALRHELANERRRSSKATQVRAAPSAARETASAVAEAHAGPTQVCPQCGFRY